MKNGLYPALITTFDSLGEIDYRALRIVVEQLIARGVDGFYVCGSTSEVMLLSKDERKRILETVVDTVAGRVDVVAHIGMQRPEDSIELARHAKAQCGVSAISALPPIYFKYRESELTDFFRSIADESLLPLIVYNAPALTGVTFTPDNIAGIFDHQNVLGMKFTSYDLFALQRIHASYPDKLLINGHDELFLNTLPLGLRCAVGSTFNFMPEKFNKIRMQYEAGNVEDAYRIQDEANRIIAMLTKVGVFRGVKGMMSLLGLPVGNCRKPFSPLTDEERAILKSAAALCEPFV